LVPVRAYQSCVVKFCGRVSDESSDADLHAEGEFCYQAATTRDERGNEDAGCEQSSCGGYDGLGLLWAGRAWPNYVRDILTIRGATGSAKLPAHMGMALCNA